MVDLFQNIPHSIATVFLHSIRQAYSVGVIVWFIYATESYLIPIIYFFFLWKILKEKKMTSTEFAQKGNNGRWEMFKINGVHFVHQIVFSLRSFSMVGRLLGKLSSQ